MRVRGANDPIKTWGVEMTSIRLPEDYRKRLARVGKKHSYLTSKTAIILFLLDLGLKEFEKSR